MYRSRRVTVITGLITQDFSTDLLACTRCRLIASQIFIGLMGCRSQFAGKAVREGWSSERRETVQSLSAQA